MDWLLATAVSTSSTDSLSGVHSFFHSGKVVAAERLFIIFLIALYLALVFWTAKDSRRRIEDPVIVGVCIATAALFPYVGVFIYMLLRPPEYLADVHERELEIHAMERRLGADQACPYCRSPADPSFLSCPYCGTKLKNACRRCKTPLDASWRLCPHCETPVTAAPPAPPALEPEPSSTSSAPRSRRKAPSPSGG